MPTCETCGVEVTRGPRCRNCAGRARTVASGVDTDTAMLAAYVDEGLSLRAIGARHGVSHERVRYRIKRAVSRLPELEQRRLYGDR